MYSVIPNGFHCTFEYFNIWVQQVHFYSGKRGMYRQKLLENMKTLLYALCFKKALLWHFTNENKKDVIMLWSIVSCILFILLRSYFWSNAAQINLICENFAWQTNRSRLYRSGQQSWRGIKTKEMWSQTIQQKLKKEEPNRSTCLLILYRFPDD